jgi:thioesterase domain-containing protein
MHQNPANGWRAHTSGRLDVVPVRGDHLTIMEEPYIADTVRTVTELLGEQGRK